MFSGCNEAYRELAGPLVGPENAESHGRAAIANRFIEGVTKAWEARDGRAYAAAFWPDAEIVSVFGGVMAGEQVIAARMDQILSWSTNSKLLILNG